MAKTVDRYAIAGAMLYNGIDKSNKIISREKNLNLSIGISINVNFKLMIILYSVAITEEIIIA